MLRCLVVAASVLLLVGCSQRDPATDQSPAPERTVVDWGNYGDGLQARIDNFQSDSDCESLQHEFDVAEIGPEVSLMQYIDEALQIANCY